MHIDTSRDDFPGMTPPASEAQDADRDPAVHPSEPNQPFYRKTWFAVLWAIIFPPIGIALLAARSVDAKPEARGFLAAIASLWLCAIIVAATAYFGFLAPYHLVPCTETVIAQSNAVSDDSTSLAMEVVSVEFGPDDNLRVIGDMWYAGGYRWNGKITLEMFDADGNRIDGIAASNLKVSCYSDKTKRITLPKAATVEDIDDIASFRITTGDGEVLIDREDSSALVGQAVEDYRQARD